MAYSIPGAHFAQLACALGASGDGSPSNALRLADQRFGVGSVVSMILRAATDVGTTADTDWASTIAAYSQASESFVETLRPREILGRLVGTRKAPMLTKIPRSVSGTTARWTGETSPISVTNASFDQLTMPPTQIATMTVLSSELVRFSNPAAEAVVRADLAGAVIEATDRMFIGVAAAEAGVSCAGIGNGATTFVSGGATALLISADLLKMCDALADAGITFKAPYFIMSPRAGIALAAKKDTAGVPAFPDMGVAGGTIWGIPVITSGSVAASGDSPDSFTVTLLDAGELIVSDPALVTVELSLQAAVQLESAPDSPWTAGVILQSLWQSGMVGFRVRRLIGWQLARSGAVCTLTGCAW